METEREEPVMPHDRREEIPHSRQEKMQYVRDCCDEILESSARLTEAKKEYKAVNAYMEDVRRVKLSEEEDGRTAGILFQKNTESQEGSGKLP